MKNRQSGSGSRPHRPKKNEFTTRSGKTIKVHRNLKERMRARYDAKVTRRAELLHMLPKGRIKRIFARLSPRYQSKYWFSREGGVMALKIVGIGAIASFLILLGIFAYFRKDLPNLKDISGTNIGGSIEYYDRTGKILLWQDYNAVKRIPVHSDEISEHLKNAEIATEDKNFYEHGGFDVRGILRSGMKDLFGGHRQGASTITMQLVKLNENWTQTITIGQKIKEVIMAVEIERSYTKDQILTGYLNAVPYGGIEYGAEAAAEDYFHTSAKDLTVAQSAMLATIPKSPQFYSPYSPDFDKKAFTGRYNYILGLMKDQGYLNQDQYQKAKDTNVLAQVHPLENKYSGIKAPYFVLAAKHELENKYGTKTVNRGGWKVITTLNMPLQKIAEKEVKNNLPNVERYGGDEEAFAAEDVKTGQMVALVGGVDFNNKDHGKINYAQTKIPPGSSFKPYDYASLINFTDNTGAGSVLYDVRQPLPGYPCTNHNRPENGGNCLTDYDFRYPGALPIRYSLGGSRNVPAVKAMLTVGTDKVIETADAMMGNPKGYQCYSNEALTKPAPCYGSSAIGDGAYLHIDEHANGLATLARLGKYLPQTYILKITDANDKTVHEWHQPEGQQVLKQQSAYIVDNMLSDPNASYLPGRCNDKTCTPLSQGGYKFQHYNGWKFAVKTGTTNDNYDGLMTSWSTQYAAVSWVGYHTRNVALRSGGMEYLTEPMTRGWMEAAHDQLNMKPVNWKEPAGIQHLPAYVITHDFSSVGGEVTPSASTDIYPSWYKPPHDGNTSQTIDIVSGKLATSCTPDLAKKTETNTNSSAFDADKFWPINNAQTQALGSDDVHNCDDEMPNIALTISPSRKSDDGTIECDGTCSANITVSAGTHPLSSHDRSGKINIMIDGQNVRTISLDSNDPTTVSYAITVDSSNVGQHKLTAQVIDSVLYDSTDSVVINFANPQPKHQDLAITSPKDNDSVSGSDLDLKWHGGEGPYVVTATDANGKTYYTSPPTPDQEDTVTLSGDQPITITVTDDTGASDSITIAH